MDNIPFSIPLLQELFRLNPLACEQYKNLVLTATVAKLQAELDRWVPDEHEDDNG